MKAPSTFVFLLLLTACGVSQTKNTAHVLDTDDEVIRLLINEVPMQKLRSKREAALKADKLFPEKSDWVSGILAHKGVSNRVKVRLKGDVHDHWIDEREWSFKVKVEDKGTVYGMNRFALQRPATRDFLNEWYLHKFLSYAGLMALNYDFVELEVNGDALPVYAMEENFHSNLVKRHGKPKGVLFKFNCDFYWREDPGIASAFHGALISPFREKKVWKDRVLSAQLTKVRESIEKFRNEQVATHELFDTDLLAKLFVAIDIMGHHHGTGLDNIRFYYNPNTELIESIGYDNQHIRHVGEQGLLGQNKVIHGHYSVDRPDYTNNLWYQYLFADTVFMKVYLKQLELMSRKEYLDEFFRVTNDDFERTLAFVQKSYPDYEFEFKEVLYKNQAFIRNQLMVERPFEILGLESNGAGLQIKLNSISGYPLAVTSLSVDGKKVFKGNALVHPEIPDNQELGVTKIPLNTSELILKPNQQISALFSILGSSKQLEAMIPIAEKKEIPYFSSNSNKFLQAAEIGDPGMNLALLDIIGCTDVNEGLEWLQGNNKGLSIKKLTYKAAKQDIWGTIYQESFSGQVKVGGPLNTEEIFRKYIATLHDLCSGDAFDVAVKGVSWFAGYYSKLDAAEKEMLLANRSFLLDYLSPYKAMHVNFKDINVLEESVILEVRNIHMLPLQLKSVVVNGNLIPLPNKVVIPGYKFGYPVTPIELVVEVGPKLIPEINRDGKKCQLDLNYAVFGVDRVLTETVKMH